MTTVYSMAALIRMPTSLLLAHCVSCDKDAEPIPDEVLDALNSQLAVRIEKAQREVEELFSKLKLDNFDTLPESPPRVVKPLSPVFGQAAFDDVVQQGVEPSEIRETPISPEWPSDAALSPVLPLRQERVQQERVQEVAQVSQAALKELAPASTPASASALDSRCYCCREFWDPSYKKPTAKEALPYVSMTNIPIYVFTPRPYSQPPKPPVQSRAEEKPPYVSITNIPIYVWPQ